MNVVPLVLATAVRPCARHTDACPTRARCYRYLLRLSRGLVLSTSPFPPRSSNTFSCYCHIVSLPFLHDDTTEPAQGPANLLVHSVPCPGSSFSASHGLFTCSLPVSPRPAIPLDRRTRPPRASAIYVCFLSCCAVFSPSSSTLSNDLHMFYTGPNAVPFGRSRHPR
ncbi:hypothetical protein BC628DRAFT_697401 [Trametes gibbosa]|nr:hypothetical protein BC628DRAFT_697401 [Trametes gibbosa]